MKCAIVWMGVVFLAESRPKGLLSMWVFKEWRSGLSCTGVTALQHHLHDSVWVVPLSNACVVCMGGVVCVGGGGGGWGEGEV